MLEVLRYAAARGLRTYELMGSPDPWKLRWTNLVRPCTSLRAYPPNALGLRALAEDTLHYLRVRMHRGASAQHVVTRLPETAEE